MSNVSRHMRITEYNPDEAPEPSEWLALSEPQRVRLAQGYHVATRANVRRFKAHAVLHAAVENQVASGYGPTKRAIARLQSEGLSRHDAIHAVGSVLEKFAHENLDATGEERASSQSRMREAIESLHADSRVPAENGS